MGILTDMCGRSVSPSGEFTMDTSDIYYQPFIHKYTDKLISCEFCSSFYWITKDSCNCPNCGAAAKVEFEYK